jgi:hypothetical protein
MSEEFSVKPAETAVKVGLGATIERYSCSDVLVRACCSVARSRLFSQDQLAAMIIAALIAQKEDAQKKSEALSRDMQEGLFDLKNKIEKHFRQKV